MALVYNTSEGDCARMISALPLQAQIIYEKRPAASSADYYERCATTLNVALNDNKGRLSPLYHWRKEYMDKLNFYTVDTDYVQHLEKSEQDKRGFSRVPNMIYSEKYKQKFLCGIVLQVNDVDYYVPVTSYKQQKPDNFLIIADNGLVVSSLRFNYMFPIPKELVTVRIIVDEQDRAYRALLAQELRYCIKNQEIIQKLAERTYKRVLLGKDLGLVANSCDFLLLEQKCVEYAESKSAVSKE